MNKNYTNILKKKLINYKNMQYNHKTFIKN